MRDIDTAETNAALTDEQLAQPCFHPRGIPYTAADAVYRLAPHDQNHEAQIRQIVEALGHSASGFVSRS